MKLTPPHSVTFSAATTLAVISALALLIGHPGWAAGMGLLAFALLFAGNKFKGI